jgi:hypothetical protein
MPPGVLLCRVQAVDRPREFVVHGGSEPTTLLPDPSRSSTAAGIGRAAVEDLAWTEWIIRQHHPGDTTALPHLFDTYGN